METTNSLSLRKFITSGAIVIGGLAAGLPAMAGILIIQNEGWQ